MEEENLGSAISSKPILPLAIGCVALALSVAALAFAVSASSRAGNAEENFKAVKDSVEKAAALSIEMKNLNSKMESTAMQLEDIKSAGVTNVSTMARQVQSSLTQLNSEIAKNRQLIAENQKAINEVAGRRGVRIQSQSGAAQASGASSSASASSASAQAASAGAKVYNVRPGDTLSLIAKKHGKSLSEIEKANPNVDSRRLQIGQEIVIP